MSDEPLDSYLCDSEPIEVWLASILYDLELSHWSDLSGCAALLSTSVATLTSDNHLVLWERDNTPSRMNAVNEINSAGIAHKKQYLFSGGFSFAIYHGGNQYRGRLGYLEWGRMLYANTEHPKVFGELLDQPPGYTVITVVSSWKTLSSLLEVWKSRLVDAIHRGKSAFYVAASKRAIQLRLHCNDVSIEEVVDVVVAASFAIQGKRRSRMLMGLSYMNCVGVPYKRYKVSIYEEYGPFEMCAL